jgi:Outer membrane lipoprotein-sorting protein
MEDAESTATLLPEETLDGKACQVVELVPKNEEFSYSKYRLWFGKDGALLDQVDVYDADAKVFKRMRMRDYKRIQDYAGRGHCEPHAERRHAGEAGDSGRSSRSCAASHRSAVQASTRVRRRASRVARS